MSSFEYQFFDYLNIILSKMKAQPLILGATTSGTGGPPGGFIGYLPQHRVAFDPVEAAVSGIPLVSGSILDNLNRIRYRLGVIESGGGVSGAISVEEEGVLVASGITVLNLENATVTVDGDTATITIPSGGSGSGTIDGGGNVDEITFWSGPTTISGDSLLKWDGSNKRIDIGFDSTDGPGTKLALGRDGAIGAGLNISNWHSTTPLPYITFYSSRGSQASPAVTVSGDTLFSIAGTGRGDSSYYIATRIKAVAAADFSDVENPSRIIFQTTPDDAYDPVDSVTIEPDGRITSTSDRITLNSKTLIIDEDIELDATGATEGQALVYDSGDDKWVPGEVSGSSDWPDITNKPQTFQNNDAWNIHPQVIASGVTVVIPLNYGATWSGPMSIEGTLTLDGTVTII